MYETHYLHLSSFYEISRSASLVYVDLNIFVPTKVVEQINTKPTTINCVPFHDDR